MTGLGHVALPLACPELDAVAGIWRLQSRTGSRPFGACRCRDCGLASWAGCSEVVGHTWSGHGPFVYSLP